MCVRIKRVHGGKKFDLLILILQIKLPMIKFATLLFSFSLFTFCLPVCAQPGWSYLPNAPTASRIDDIYFVNTDTGVIVDSYGRFYKTEDGGDTWSLKFYPGNYMRSVEFLNDSVGFAGSLYGNLYKTTNGGDSWTEISNLIVPSVPGICGLNTVDDTVIYGVGIWSEPAYVIKTTNSGQSWSHINMSNYAHGLVDCYFFSSDTGFVTGIDLNDHAIVLYTDDGGLSWESKFVGNIAPSYAWKIQWLDRYNGVVCIASLNYSSSSQMIMTSDGGMTWDLKTVTPSYNELEGIGFINKAHGWVGGYLTGMYETTDTGATWNLIPFAETVNRYFKVNDTLVYCSGASIYKFTDTATIVYTNTSNISLPFVPIHSLEPIVPNPAKDQITLHYSISNKTMVDLSVFNIDGKRLRRIVHGQQDKGDYTLNEETASLSPGKYFVVLNTNEGAVNATFVITK